jgi:putative two-component system response regulator
MLTLRSYTVKKQILIVDDDQRVLDALRRSLREYSGDWSMTFVRHPETAWEQLLETAFDAVVTDVRMPGLNGLDLLERIRRTERTKDVPVVVLTGLDEQDLKEKALDLGASDLLNKPVQPRQLVARLRNVLERKAYEDDLRARNHLLTERVQQQDFDLAQSRMSVICRLGMAAEFRDEATGNHVVRVGCYSRAIAAVMDMPNAFLELLLLAAPLHDIGKIGIPDSVLLKPGPLSDEEWTIMQRHCEIGASILRKESKTSAPLFDLYSAELQSINETPERYDPMMEMAA